MTAREKILEVERQTRAIAAGEASLFRCPFCGQSAIPENGGLCCYEAAEVVEAVLDHVEFKNNMENVARIMDRFSSAVLAN